MDQILARDYSNYLVQNSISTEVEPICKNIDDMLTRLDEFESLLNAVKENISVSTDKNLPEIATFQKDFSELCQRIDGFERFITIAGDNLSRMEAHMSVAEHELGYTESGFKGFLKPIFGRQKTEQDATNLAPGDVYTPPEVLKLQISSPRVHPADQETTRPNKHSISSIFAIKSVIQPFHNVD